MEQYKNLIKKYGITLEELESAIKQINLGKISCPGNVLLALADLLVYGDIKDTSGGEQ